MSRLLLLSHVLPNGLPFLNLFLAVLLAASLFGKGPGYFAVFLGAGLTMWFSMEPLGTFWVEDPRQLAATALFAGIAGLMARIIGELQEAVELRRSAETHQGLLLREFRHRTRNDLNSLVALLLMRARTASPAARDGLREAADHAMALARVHTWLASASPGDGEEAVVDSREFVLGLVADLQRAAGAKGLRPVAIIADAEAHQLNTERAVQLGLVLNELLTNALKYAFPAEDMTGTVQITFQREAGDFLLTVADDGHGMPEETVPQSRHGGLGTRLLRGLAAQLRGQFSRGPGPAGGVVAQLRFPAVAPTMLPMPKPELARA